MPNHDEETERVEQFDEGKVKLSEIKAAYDAFMVPMDTPDDMLDLLDKLK